MTEQEKKQMMEEINETRNKFNSIKSEMTVKSDFPEISRTYTYRKTTKVYAHDLNL